MSVTSSAKTIGQDAISGFLVFLIALPLCLGISIASGFPPVAGILTAIIGGVIGAHIGSAPLTIKGPAAGLIVIALGSVMELGGGDAVLGYRRTLAVGAVAAVIQIALAVMRAGGLAIVMPPAVVHGMLAAIGVIIVTKQFPVMIGTKAIGKPLEGFIHIPDYIAHINPEILVLGVLAMLTLIIVPRLPWVKIRKIPASLIALLLTIPLGVLFHLSAQHDYTFMSQSFHVGPEFLVQLPGNLLDAITFPDFSVIMSGASIKYIIMFAIVGSIESLLSVLAVDAMDPEHRASNMNKDLLATGIGNLLCAMIGGLPMISEIVRSKANIDAGAKSTWSNFFHGLYLLLFVALLPGLLQLIPLSVLAMLVLTGLRLASPSEFKHALHMGKDQLAIFVTTFLVTLATDLLVGVIAGLFLKLAMHIARGASPLHMLHTKTELVTEGDCVRIILHGPVTFTNFFPWFTRLKGLVTTDIKLVEIDMKDVTLMDVTTQEKLHIISNEWQHTRLVFINDEHLTHTTNHEYSFMKRTS
jgi:MFS superfamily sulfate permease-like transporter